MVVTLNDYRKANKGVRLLPRCLEEHGQEEGHIHKCRKHKGHTTQHQCNCNRTWKRMTRSASADTSSSTEATVSGSVDVAGS